MLHDTHAHLDLLLQRVGMLPDGREFDLETSQSHPAISDQALAYLTTHIQEHEFVIQPTISTRNFVFNYHATFSIKKIWYLIGTHPEMVGDDFDIDGYLEEQDTVINGLKGVGVEYRVVGVGECGLDYFHAQSPQSRSKQQDLFRSQIDLALQLDVPLVIHTRDAFEDTWKILDEYPAIHGRFLVHCFTGGVEELQQVIKRGGKVGIGGIVTFNSAKDLQLAVAQAPLDSIMLETDLPFLSPVPQRGQVCEPKFIQHVANHIAILKDIPVQSVWQTSRNEVNILFGI